MELSDFDYVFNVERTEHTERLLESATDEFVRRQILLLLDLVDLYYNGKRVEPDSFSYVQSNVRYPLHSTASSS